MKYLLLATIGTILFFGGYWLLMRRDTHFGMVRAYLVGSLILALTLPAVHLRVSMPAHYTARMETAMPKIVEWRTLSEEASPTVSKMSIEITSENSQEVTSDKQLSIVNSQSQQKPWWQRVLPWVWLAGCAVSASILLLTFLNLRRRLRGMPYEWYEGVSPVALSTHKIKLSLLDDDTPAFSFGRHIVVGRKGFSDEEVQQLVSHELVHVSQSHSIDLIICRLVQIVLWFNPFVWLYERELKRVHEYIADRTIFQSDRGAKYAELFYHQVSGRRYMPLCNTFDYSITGKRIAMMATKPSSRKSFKWLALVPIVAVMLVVGCVPKNTLDGIYQTGKITLLSDNPAEPDLVCSEFLGLENQQFVFSRDGQLKIVSTDSNGKEHKLTYKMDDDGLHIYDSTGSPWLDMTLETRHCDGDSIVLRFVDKDPVGGLSKMLKGLPFYYYRVDTVMVSYSGTGTNGEHIEVNPHQEVDTVFAHVTAPCEYGKWCNNRLLLAASSSRSTGVSEYTDTTGNTVSRFYTGWEFHGDTITSNARAWYDTADYSSPRMEGDRFILEVILKK